MAIALVTEDTGLGLGADDVRSLSWINGHEATMQLLLKALVFCVIATNALAAERLLGVNRNGIAWLPQEEAQRSIDAMAAAKVPAIRIMLVTPIEKTVDVIAYANSKGIGVLLQIPLTHPAYYPPNAERRPGGKGIREVHRLSNIDLARFESLWKRFVALIENRRIKIIALQIGNEFNSADFNGDLPIVPGGAIATSRTLIEYQFATDYDAGMDKLVAAARVVRSLQRSSEALKGTQILLGGMARPLTSWLKSSGNALVEPEDALRILKAKGIDDSVDAYSIHIYPRASKLPREQLQQAISKQFDDYLGPLTKVAANTKPWWITEWGAVLPRGANRDDRLPVFCAYLAALNSSRWSPMVPATFIFDWEESSQYAIYRNNEVLGAPPTNVGKMASESCSR